jgi:hypothetical protein
MFELSRLWLGTFRRIFCTRQSLMLENLALRQQLAVLNRKHPRARLGPLDKLFWVVVRGFWSQWKDALVLTYSGNSSGSLVFETDLLVQRQEVETFASS